MAVGIVLNELSITSPASDKYLARQWMVWLGNTVLQAVEYGASLELRTTMEFFSLCLAPNYPVNKWINDHDVDEPLRDYFLDLITWPPLDDLPEILDRTYLIDFEYEGMKVKGLGYAYLMEGLAVSFQSSSQWDTPQVSFILHKPDEEDENIVSETIVVRHASQSAHVDEHASWITQYETRYFLFYAPETVWQEIQQQPDIIRILQEKFSKEGIRKIKTQKKSQHRVYDDGKNDNRVFYFEKDNKLYIYKTFDDHDKYKRFLDSHNLNEKDVMNTSTSRRL